MKKLFCAISILLVLKASAQEKFLVHTTDHFTLGVVKTSIDAVGFSDDTTTMIVSVGDFTTYNYFCKIDSITFGEGTDTIEIDFNNNDPVVYNPWAFEGVVITRMNSDINITSTTETKDICYRVTGTATNGSIKIYSDKRFTLMLNNTSITNADGPAINIQSNKKCTVYLPTGTENSLSDGTTYATAPNNSEGEAEDQKGAFFSEGDLYFEGNGSLTLTGIGQDQHALCSDETIEVNGSTLIIATAVKDGIHAKDGFYMTDGSLDISTTGDGIDGDGGLIQVDGGSIVCTLAADDTKAFTCDSTIIINDGTIEVNIIGDQSKGFKTDQTIRFLGGTITATCSGNVVLETLNSGYNPAYCVAVKSGDTLLIDGANITIKHSGKGGKGLSSDADIEMLSGTVNITMSGAGSVYTDSTGSKDAYSATGLTCDGNARIIGGSLTISNSGSAGKAISTDGTLTFGSGSSSPSVTITTTGSDITISTSGWGQTSTDAAEAKSIKSDSDIIINNGEITISSADDGIKSESSVTINNGTFSITKSYEAIESPKINVNGGTVSLVASDDGFNATYGTGSDSSDGSLLSITGGYINVNATDGDGLDSNGSISISGGTIVVNGPQSSPEVGLDYNGTCNVSGGFIVISGPNSGNMIQAMSTSSTQYGLKIISKSSLSSSTLFHIEDASGNSILTFQPKRTYYYIVFSSPDLVNGSSYKIYTGGSSTGTNVGGLYTGGTYKDGTLKTTFKISSTITSVSF